MISAVIDGNYLLHRCMRAGDLGTLRNRYGKPTGGIYGFLKSLQSVLSDNSVERCYTVFDGGVSTRRREIFPGYKGRKWRELDDPFYEERDETDKQFDRDFRVQQAYLKRILRKLGVRVIQLEGWEGDDLIYRISTLHAPEGIVYIVSDDKDFFQVPTDYTEVSIQLIRPIAGQHITEATFDLVVGYPQEEFFLRKAVNGDGSDKIPGVDGVGSGTLNKIFNEGAPVCPYPFEDFFSFCADHRSKRVQRISDQRNVVIRNVELVDLEMELYSDKIAQEVQEKSEIVDAVDINEVKSFLTDMDMFTIVKILHWWVLPFQRLR